MVSDAAVQLTVLVDEVDLASGLLWGAGVSAVSEATTTNGRVLLTADLPAGGIEAVNDALGGRWSVEQIEVADDGLDAWRAHAVVSHAGEHLVVRPPWLGYEPSAGEVVLDIDPGRSFGHGAHPTTQLVLAQLERLVRAGNSVLDVGCGSGVLAIAAARLGAKPVIAVDIDPAALAATAANAGANNVEVEASNASVDQVGSRFDLVLANIGAAALQDLAPRLVQRVAPGGFLVLSGLLSGRWNETADAYSETCELERVDELDGWAALTLLAAKSTIA